MDALDLLRRAATAPRPSLEDAYRMGRDCALHGADSTNCHFALFRSPEMTAEWERGKREADHD